MAGITCETRRNWLKWGADQRANKIKIVPISGTYTEQTADGPHEVTGTVGWRSGRWRAFLDAVERAEAMLRSGCIGNIRVAGVDQWQAAAWLLERRFSAEYARTERHEVSGKDGGPVEVEAMSPEERRAEIERLERKLGLRPAADASPAGDAAGHGPTTAIPR